MRHGKRIKKIGRTAAHRKATLASMSTALIQHKRITTTYTKAKALRGFVEPLINRAKSDTVHNRRQVFRRLQDKQAVTILFDEVAEKIGDRTGGYTRVIKLGRRQGDAAEVALIELVDYNDVKPDGSSSGQKRKTRRSRRRKTSEAAATVEAAATGIEVVEADEAVEVVEVVEETTAEVSDEAQQEEEIAEATDSAEEAPEAEADKDQPVSEEREDEAEGESAGEEESEGEDEDAKRE